MHINAITMNLDMFRSDVLGICPDSKTEKRWNINEIIKYRDHLGLKEFADPGSYNGVNTCSSDWKNNKQNYAKWHIGKVRKKTGV